VCVNVLDVFLKGFFMSDRKGIIRTALDVVTRATAKALIKDQIDRMEGVTEKPTLSELIIAKAIARTVEGVARNDTPGNDTQEDE